MNAYTWMVVGATLGILAMLIWETFSEMRQDKRQQDRHYQDRLLALETRVHDIESYLRET